MASLQSSRSRNQGNARLSENEAPEHLPSEGEILIKQMVKKQLGTQLSLDKQLMQNKEFEKAIEFEPLTNYVSGQSTLKEFEESSLKVTHKESLQSSGLNNDEIDLLLDHDKGEEFLNKKYKNVEGSILQTRLKRIKLKIMEADAKRINLESKMLSKKLSRHDQELVQSEKPESEHTRLYQFALSCQSSASTSDLRPPTHPINQLKEIEQELFGHLAKKSRLSKKNKRCRTETPNKTVPDETVEIFAPKSHGLTSQWDVVDVVPTFPQKKKEKPYTCKPQKLYTIRNKQIVPLNEPILPADNKPPSANIGGRAFIVTKGEDFKETLMENNQQLTVEQIKELPKFANYSQGLPSKALFVKNLHDSVIEEDLVSLFGQFEAPGKPRITYRLMTGKMRGQAFINFCNTDVAASALLAINGYFLKGKPVIVQFGKSSG